VKSIGGAEVRAVASATEALRSFQEHKPDLIIGDIGMPDVDGYEMIRRIRALPAAAGGEIPAVALTAFSRMEDRNRALLAGYQYHLAKPVEFAELAVTLAMITKRVPRP
jgi:CheY-like chemotaxis protein